LQFKNLYGVLTIGSPFPNSVLFITKAVLKKSPSLRDVLGSSEKFEFWL